MVQVFVIRGTSAGGMKLAVMSAAEGQQVPAAIQVDAFEVDVGDRLVGGATGSPLVDPLVGQAVQKIEGARLAGAALRAEQADRAHPVPSEEQKAQLGDE